MTTDTQEKEKSGYVIICSWRDENNEDIHICNSTIYTSLEEAKKVLKEIVEEDIKNNDFHQQLYAHEEDDYISEYNDDCTYYWAYADNYWDTWHFEIWIQECKIK